MGRKSQIRETLFTALELATDTGIFLYDFAYNAHHYAYGEPKSINRYALYKLVHRLKDEGILEITRSENKILIKLTSKGKEDLEIFKKLSEDKWDGKWRVVVFDIPEKYRKVRDSLRIKLKEWGFKQLQKSTWVTKHDIAEPVEDFVRKLGVEDWVLVFVADNKASVHKMYDRK